MDHASFDRFARLLGRATSRRAGIGAALAALTSGALATEAGAAKRTHGAHGGKVKPAGPCGDGTVKDNRCRKNAECCTNICKTKNKGKDGSGRCRCQRKRRPCTEDRN
ncbi:MAG: hypothetical protein ACR2J8_09865, partial [Thermomicrobiales bacterium]